MGLGLQLLCVLAWSAARAACQGAADVEPVALFQAGVPPPNNNYRIPSIVGTPSVVVAIVESRLSAASDCAAKSLVYRSSMDGGHTWGPQDLLFGNATAGDVVGNPLAVYDAVRGVIVVHFAVGSPRNGCHGSIMQLDDGGTGGAKWGNLLNVTEQIGWLPKLPGPGVGTQLASGRLVMVAAGGTYLNDYVYFSDDGGEHWTLSPTALPLMDEIAVATLTDGTVVVNMRNDHVNSCKCRAYSVSTDSGATWSLPISYDPTLISPVCEASFVRIGDFLYFSNPASTVERRDITIRRAPANCTASTMPPAWQNSTLLVAPGVQFGGYSVVVPMALAPGVGGIIFEAGPGSASSSSVNFTMFPLDF